MSGDQKCAKLGESAHAVFGRWAFLHDQQNFSAPVGGIVFQLVLKLVAVYGDDVGFGACQDGVEPTQPSESTMSLR